MRKFEISDKINFVDSNNVFVGYDLGQDCCEDADWFIAEKVQQVIPSEAGEFDIEGFVFDPEFFETFDEAKEEGTDWNTLDEGGMAVFKMVNGDKELFLHIYNSHNGYYGHGFIMRVGEKSLHAGIL